MTIRSDPTLPKKPSTLRLLVQNVSSISLPHEFKLQHLLQRIDDMAIDITCLSEHSMNTYNTKVHELWWKNINCIWRQSKTVMTSTPDRSAKLCKYGGSLLLVAPSTSQRTKISGQDPMGRWVWVDLYTKSKPLRIISAYMPCQQSLQAAGPWTYYRQLWRSHRAISTNPYEPRSAAWKDLTTFIKYSSSTHNILLGMDVNCNANRTSNELASLKNKCNLVDFVSQLGGKLKHQCTYKRVVNRIDVIIGSYEILPYITNLQHLAYDQITNSDHRGILIDLDATKVFSNPCVSPTSPNARSLDLRKPTKVDKYITYLEQYMKFHRLEYKLQECHNTLNEDPTNEKAIGAYLKCQDLISRGQITGEKFVAEKPIDTLGLLPLYQQVSLSHYGKY